jgi:NAD(P)H-hydrate epimerase
VIPVLTADEMRRADQHTIEHVGLPGAVLMENAGAAVARLVVERFPEARDVVVVCGRGMNGGDGFVVTRRLGPRAEALLLGRRDEVAGDARTHLLACERSGGRVAELSDTEAWRAALGRVEQADLVVDAVLGTGLRSAPSGLAALAIAAIRARCDAGRAVVAVDLPSGISADTGMLEWPVARASFTVTFAAPKRGHVLPPACDQVGELVIADIGIPAASLAGVGPTLFLIEDRDAAEAFPRRGRGAHKGDFGHVLVVAGSLGKTGAAVLAASGALRSGAGLLTVATPAPCLPVVAAARPELMTEPLAVTGSGGLDPEGLKHLVALARERDAVVLGPGLGQDEATRELVNAFVGACPVPLVVDATFSMPWRRSARMAKRAWGARRPRSSRRTRARWRGCSGARPPTCSETGRAQPPVWRATPARSWCLKASARWSRSPPGGWPSSPAATPAWRPGGPATSWPVSPDRCLRATAPCSRPPPRLSCTGARGTSRQSCAARRA